jgi:transcriptional regulator with XRE-family HTH domain
VGDDNQAHLSEYISDPVSIRIWYRDAVELLQNARTRAGLSQRELARRAGTSQAMVARIERGQQSPSLATLERLVTACGLELRVRLAGGDDTPAAPRRERRRGRLLVWHVGDEPYAFPLEAVDGIVAYTPPRRLPGQGPEAGVVVSRDRVIATVDAGRRLGSDAADADQIVVVDTASGPCGVVVGRTRAVTGPVDIAPAPAGASAAGYVAGLAFVDDDTVVVIDPEQFCHAAATAR